MKMIVGRKSDKVFERNDPGQIYVTTGPKISLRTGE